MGLERCMDALGGTGEHVVIIYLLHDVVVLKLFLLTEVLC